MKKKFKILESGGQNKNKNNKIVQSIKEKKKNKTIFGFFFFIFFVVSCIFGFKLTLKGCARKYLLVGFQ